MRARMARAAPTTSSHGLPLHAQGGQQGPHLGRGPLPVHDPADHAGHLVGGQVPALDHPGQRDPQVERLDSAVRPGAHGCSFRSEEVAQQVLAHRGQERLGVKLHALDRQALVAQSHDLLVPGLGRDFQAVGQAVARHHQRVVAGGLEGVGQPGEQPSLVVEDARGLAVHHLAGAHHLARRRPGRSTGGPGRRPGWAPCPPARATTSSEIPASFGVQGPGEMTMRSGDIRCMLFDRDLVVAHHLHRAAPARPGTGPGCR